MDKTHFREVRNVITWIITRSDLDFLVRIKRNFIHEKKFLLICKDKKTLVLANRAIAAIGPSLDNHSVYESRDPKTCLHHNLWNLDFREGEPYHTLDCSDSRLL